MGSFCSSTVPSFYNFHLIKREEKWDKWIICQLLFKIFKVIRLFRIASPRSCTKSLHKSKQINQTAEEKIFCQKTHGIWWPALGQPETKPGLSGFMILFIQQQSTYLAEILGAFAVSMLLEALGLLWLKKNHLFTSNFLFLQVVRFVTCITTVLFTVSLRTRAI